MGSRHERRPAEQDRHHEAANRTLRTLLRQGRRILTTDYIFDEVVTRVRSLADHPASVMAGRYVLESEVIEIAEVDQAVREAAWRKYRKHGDHPLSFTDCTSFATMEMYGVREAFTFDADFAKVGFVALPSKSR